MAGVLKRASPDIKESLVLMRALRDMNHPKFVFEDVPLFLGLIKDLFPGMDCPRVGYPDFNAAVEFVSKIIDKIPMTTEKVNSLINIDTFYVLFVDFKRRKVHCPLLPSGQSSTII